MAARSHTLLAQPAHELDDMSLARQQPVLQSDNVPRNSPKIAKSGGSSATSPQASGPSEGPHRGHGLDHSADAEEHREDGAPKHPRLLLLALLDVAPQTLVPVPSGAQLLLDGVRTAGEEL